MTGGEARPEVTRSSRDLEETRLGLEAWLATQLPAGSGVAINSLEGSSANGMSSDTFLFDATWTDVEGGTDHVERLVARVAPDPSDIPVHPHYDLASQFEVMRRVGASTSLPIPQVCWLENDGGPFGAPFFVMRRVDGLVPPDVMPYPFGDNWLFDADQRDQRRLQDTTVAALAELHAIADVERFAFLGPDTDGDTALRRHVAHAHHWYRFASKDLGPSPLIERALAWLDSRWPHREGPTVVSWGDSRIGNVLYRDFEPAGILDWEMARLGPRELDVSWLVYSHRVFDDFAASAGLPGMPTFLDRNDVATAYEAQSGYTPRDLDFYCVYAATVWSIIFLRTSTRSIHFGQSTMPADVDALVMNREPLEQMLDGSYWK